MNIIICFCKCFQCASSLTIILMLCVCTLVQRTPLNEFNVVFVNI